MAAGTVISFDAVKGYGFISPETGTEDVFLHVNDFPGGKHLLQVGSVVEFEVENGERGPKATGVRLVHQPGEGRVHAGFSDAAPVAGGLSRTGPGALGAPGALGVGAYQQELTEALMAADPQLTAQQILRIRSAVVEVARRRGWVQG